MHVFRPVVSVVLVGLVAMVTGTAIVSPAVAQAPGAAGLRGGIGTDINGGIAWGGEINYTRELGKNAVQLGLNMFGGGFDESSTEFGHTYDEHTDLFVVGVLANYLFSYSLDSAGPYFVVGFGFGSVSVDWEERSRTDTSLGTPLAGGGSMQSVSASAGGSIVNLGIGHRFNEKMDIRFQTPTFLIFGGPDDASATVPTFTLTVGMRM